MNRRTVKDGEWRRPQTSMGAFGTAIMAAILAAFSAFPSDPARAGWLTKLVREASDAGGSAARHAGSGIDNVAGLAHHLKSLPADTKGLALAAHATPEGHWKFVNRDGEVFTAASPSELARVADNLAPDRVASGQPRLSLYLDEETVFTREAALRDLPANSDLYLISGTKHLPLKRHGGKPDGALVAEVKPNVLLKLGDRRHFDEAMWQLGRPLRKSSLRVVSLEPGAAQTLPVMPRLDPTTKAALVDRVDPWKLAAGLKAVRGQTVIVTGRTDGRYLHFQPATGPERSILLEDLSAAARNGDVNLVILEAARPWQPGGRNWLWQKVEISGLAKALNRATFADFLDALGAGRGQLMIETSDNALGRARFDIRPTGVSASPVGSVFGDWTDDIVAHVAGNVVTEAIKLDLVDEDRQTELDRRIVPGVPFILQALYLAGVVLGLAGLSLARSWWRRIWPPEERGEYQGRLGFLAARAVRGLAFLFVFLPLVGIPAGVWAIIAGALQQVWWIVTAPFRFLYWVFGRFSAARG
ncbi:MAG: hypothetical protein KDJ37_03450 [Hyphomicrobiaceae bacterium]|nr:hypothetical protein [Hyphomicrobiaceae bacterium]